MTSTEKAIRVLPFDGKRSSWTMWEAKYKARAKKNKFLDVMLGNTTVPDATAVIDISNDAGKSQLRAREANDEGYNDLLLSMEEEVAFGLVNEAKTTALPDGCLKTAWDALSKRYEPRTKNQLVALKSQFTKRSLEKEEDPDEWITDLEALNRKIKNIDANRAYSNDDLLIHIAANVTEEYDNVVQQLEKRIGSSTNALTLMEMREELSTTYEKWKKRHDSEKIDTALIATQNKTQGKFKGRCYVCGKFGHKGSECRNRNNNSSSTNNTVTNSNSNVTNNSNNQISNNNTQRRFQGTCFYCGKKGHRENRCWKKQREQEQANAVTELEQESNEIEHILCGFEIEDDTSDYSSIPDDFFDDWNPFETEDDDDSVNEACLMMREVSDDEREEERESLETAPVRPARPMTPDSPGWLEGSDRHLYYAEREEWLEARDRYMNDL